MELQSLFRLVDFKSFSIVTNGLLFLTTTCILCFLLSLNYWKRSWDKRLPGPTGLPILGYLPFLGPVPHQTICQLGEKYGDIFSLYLGRKYTVVLNEYSVMKEVFYHPGALDRDTNIFEHIPRIGFVVDNGDKWLEQRRFCLTAVREIGLGNGRWKELIMEEISIFVGMLQKLNGQPTDISSVLTYSLASGILSVLIGRSLKMDKDAEVIETAVGFSDVSLVYTGPSLATTVIPGLRRFCEIFKIAGYDRTAEIIRQFSSFLRDEIYRHKTTPELRDNVDFINSYLEKISEAATSGKKHYFSESMLEGNMKLLFLGSSDTNSSSLGWLLRIMAKHKDVQEKVYSELMEVIGKDGEARYEERAKIPYTFAVILESQRISSIVPLSTTRKANRDIHVRGYVIPKGSDITANLWAMHYNPMYWDEPNVFRPERFLTDGGTKIVKNPPGFAAFSIGRRNCPGESFALMQILFYFTEIIKKFEISTPPGVEPEFIVINGLVSHLAPQPICFKLRKEY